MSEKENKRLVQRLFEEALGQGNLAVVDELVAPDFVSHSGEYATREGFKQGIVRLHELTADLHYVIEDIFAKDERVVIRARGEGTLEEIQLPPPIGIPRKTSWSQRTTPSRRTFTTQEIHLFYLKNGKIVEHWLGTWFPYQLAPL